MKEWKYILMHRLNGTAHISVSARSCEACKQHTVDTLRYSKKYEKILCEDCTEALGARKPFVESEMRAKCFAFIRDRKEAYAMSGWQLEYMKGGIILVKCFEYSTVGEIIGHEEIN